MDSGYWSPVLLDTEFHNNKNKTELICHWVESPDILIPPLTMVAHLNLVIVRVRSEAGKDIFWISNIANYKSFHSGKILKLSVCDSIWLTYVCYHVSGAHVCGGIHICPSISCNDHRDYRGAWVKGRIRITFAMNFLNSSKLDWPKN